jgi:AIPR protein
MLDPREVCMTAERPDLPRFLSTYDDFMAHVEEQFVDLKPHAKGRRFVTFALDFIPQIEEAAGFSGLELSEKQSHDEGIDLLTAQTESGQRLFVQSKFRIRTKDELDTILSKFEAFEADSMGQGGQGALFGEPQVSQPVFMIITASKLDGIINLYTNSRLSSRPFWDKLRAERRIHIIDGPRILQRLQVLYAKSFLLPPEVTIESKAGWLVDGPVLLGTISGRQLVSLYERHGDGLFFENIRDFLGTGTTSSRDTVNSKIIETIIEAPAKMLERNNGITMRAHSVRQLDDKTIEIDGAAIVNGCQTTMCLVHCKDDMDEALYVQ